MKNAKIFLAGMAAALLLTGCQSGTGNADAEALRQQIADLEEQVAALQQSQSQKEPDSEKAGTQAGAQTPDSAQEDGDPQQDSSPTDSSPQQDNTPADSSPQQDSSPADQKGSGKTAVTTETMESLISMVDGYETEIGELLSESAVPDLDRFFAEKQRAEEIDRALDLHEDELENAVRRGTLSRSDYRSLEKDLERLEDRLDAAEDSLEIFYRIDD